MIRVTQTIMGEQGNCFAACVASLLELDVEELPNFAAAGEGWWEKFRAWLRENVGFDAVCANEQPGSWLGRCTSIAIGRGPRGYRHACLYMGSALLWDPHPDGDGLIEADEVVLLVPLDPASLRTVAPLGGGN